MKTKYLIPVICFAAISALAYNFLSSKQSYPDKAYTHLVQGNYVAAEKALDESAADQLVFPLALYKGYLAQARGRYRESDYFLQTLLSEPPRVNQKEILVETLLAQITNAYQEKRDREISPLIETAKHFSSGNSFLFFFDGLSHYLHNQYSDALRFWASYQPIGATHGSGWMEHMIEHFYPCTWRQLHVAHCLTEEGDILAGRQILEKEQHQIGNQQSELHHLATLFLGLTYLKECADIPIEERGSYYKLAHFYFERAEKVEPFAREKERIIAHVQGEVDALFSSPFNPIETKWGFAFVRTLQDWKATEALNCLCANLVQKMVGQYDSAMAPFCQTVCKEFRGSQFHSILSNHLHDALADNLRCGAMEELCNLWHLAAQLSPSPQTTASKVAMLTQEEMFKTIFSDDNQLQRTRRYLAFWSLLNQGEESHKRMAVDLFKQATLFWKKEGQEKKGLRLMELAMQLTPDKKEIENGISSFLTGLYTQAENSNMIQRLSLIHDALIGFGMNVNKKDLLDGSTLANHLADAEYLYSARNYAAAQTHAQWVLKLDPQNEKALRIVGLASFHLGDYHSALNHLQQVSHLDDSARKAIAFSQAFASQQQSEHIAQIDNTDSFDED